MKQSKRYTVLVALIVALGGFLLGFDSAVISGAVPFIKRYFVLNDIQLGWGVSCLILGAMGGNAVAGPLSDRFGRKRILIGTAVLFTLSALVSAVAAHFSVFVASRIVGGMAVGGAILIAPVYIAEIAPARLRGSLVSFNQLNIVIGISASYFSNYFLLPLGEHSWRWMLGVEAIPAVLYFALLFAVPESPRWLFRRGQQDLAKEILIKAGGAEHAEEEFSRIGASFARQDTGTSFLNLLGRNMRFIMFIALAIGFFQQITGINAILYYAPVIFSKAGGGQETAFMQAVIVGLVNLVMTLVAIRLIDRWGRKPLLLIGAAGMAVSLLVCSWAFHAANYQLTPKSFEALQAAQLPADLLTELKAAEKQVFSTEQQFMAYLEGQCGADRIKPHRDALVGASLNIQAKVVLVAIVGFVASFAISLGPVMWVLLSEIFPNRLRGMAISLAGFWNSVVSFTVTLVFPWELSNLGSAGTYLTYGLLALAAFVFVLVFIPETKGKSLEELEGMLMRA
jgi:MFS family permease